MRRVGAAVTESTANSLLDAAEAAGHDGPPNTTGSDRTADTPSLGIFRRMHPLGIVCAAVLIVAVLWHTVFSTERLIGNFSWWHWAGLILMTALSVVPKALHGLRLAIDMLASVILQLVWVVAWLVFIVQLFNVVTRYLNPLFDADILIGQMTSLAWQLFAALAILGLNYGVKAGVNPRVDFWWADWSTKKKAWLDFVMHVFFFLPFLFMAIGVLQRYAAISLGQRRTGEWPEGWQVWKTWENSPDADQLAVGGVKALLFVGFILFALQILAEVIKVGFVLAGRSRYADIADRDEFQRIE